MRKRPDVPDVRLLPLRSLIAKLPLGLWRGKGNVRVFAYHRVNIDDDSPLSVHRAMFERHMEYLRDHFTLLSFRGLLQMVKSGAGERSEERFAMVTFDDGYGDNFTNALPVLEALGISACFFVTTGYIGTKRVFPWDEAAGRRPSLMTWEEVSELRRRGFEIGSHTVSHSKLASLRTDAFLRELEASKETLEARLGERVGLFAYPFGRFGDYVPGWSGLVGRFYEVACTAIRGLNSLNAKGLLELHRTAVLRGWSWNQFVAEAQGKYDWVDRVRALLAFRR